MEDYFISIPTAKKEGEYRWFTRNEPFKPAVFDNYFDVLKLLKAEKSFDIANNLNYKYRIVKMNTKTKVSKK